MMHSFHSRYKSELKVVPEDSPQLDAHGGGGGIGAAPRQRTSLSSVGSGSTSASSGGGHIGSSRDSLHRAAPTGKLPVWSRQENLYILVLGSVIFVSVILWINFDAYRCYRLMLNS